MRKLNRDILAIALFALCQLLVFATHACFFNDRLKLKASMLLLMFIGGVVCHIWVRFIQYEISRGIEEERPLLSKC
jgi:hypothetical protein